MNEINMYRGNNRTVSLTIEKKSNGEPYELTDCTVTMLVKKNINDADIDAIIIKEGLIINAEKGIIEFYLIPEDTDNALELKDDVPYPVDYEVETLEHKKYTVLRTWLTILTK